MEHRSNETTPALHVILMLKAGVGMENVTGKVPAFITFPCYVTIFKTNKFLFSFSIPDPDPDWIQIQESTESGFGIRIQRLKRSKKLNNHNII